MTDLQFVFFQDDGSIPNNPLLPAAIYKNVLPPEKMEAAFHKHNWSNSWTNGILNDHHYHSNTHEVLGVIKGDARLMIGGPSGDVLEVTTGDVIVLPAGTGHKCLESSNGFSVIGAYPDGMDYNMKYGKPGERPEVLEDIKRVPLPSEDPVFGDNGPLFKKWTNPERNI